MKTKSLEISATQDPAIKFQLYMVILKNQENVSKALKLKILITFE